MPTNSPNTGLETPVHKTLFAEDPLYPAKPYMVYVLIVARRGKCLRSTTSPHVPTHHASYTLAHECCTPLVGSTQVPRSVITQSTTKKKVRRGRYVDRRLVRKWHGRAVTDVYYLAAWPRRCVMLARCQASWTTIPCTQLVYSSSLRHSW